MTLSITKLPNSIGVGAQVTYTDSTAKNASESGNVNRKLLRPIKRNYMCGVSPDDSLEIQTIIMATRGARYPLALQDPTGYKFDNDTLHIDADGHALLGKVWAPATGSLSVFQRVMIPDGALIFELNGSPASPTVGDYGVINFGVTLVPGVDEPVVVSGQYLTPVCFLDQPSATAMSKVGGVVIYQFSDLRFEEIFEAELRALLA